jgi:protein phosphatase
MQTVLRYAARSDVGLGPKSRNEDSGYAGAHLLVLADGMGGHAAGDVASSMVVGYLAPLDDDAVSAEQALRHLQETLVEANTGLGQAMDENPDLDGMGTTTIAMLRAGNKLAMAHIGDSRAYLLHEGALTQITKDHSFVQQLVDSGRISAEEAEHHPQRSLVTKVMTGSPDDEPDLSIRELVVGDRYLLCSDGLSDYVSFGVIEEILAAEPTPELAAQRCVDVALKASTRDNVTVIVADVVDLDDESLPPGTTPQIVGAAGVRQRRTRTRAIPVSPAEKAAMLARDVAGIDTDPEPEVSLAEDTPTRTVRLVRRAVLGILVVVAAVGGGYGAYAWSQRQMYVGSTDGKVAVYRGVAQDLGPIRLSTVEATTDVAVADLPTYYQELVTSTFAVKDTADADSRIATLREIALACRSRTDQSQPCTLTAPPNGSTTGPTTSSSLTTTGSLPGAPTATTGSTPRTASPSNTAATP